MEHNNTHFHKTNKTNKTSKPDTATKADRKREQKMQAKEMENFVASTTNTQERSGNNKDSQGEEEEEEEETETSANTATFKRVKTNETTHFETFETISSSNHCETDGEQASSQGFEFGQTGFTMSSNTTSEADEFIPIGERLAALYKGTLMSRETQNGRGGCKGLRFKCNNNHVFTISYGKLKTVPSEGLERETCKDIWCVKCHNFYYRCKKKAMDNGAIVTSRIFDPGYVTLNCRNKHNFGISIHRNPDKTWCSNCRKEMKYEKRKKIEIERERKKQESSEQQKKLFEESRKYLQTEQSNQNFERQFSVQDILVQVDLKAKFETQKFINNQNNEMNEINIYTVYKIIYMPSEILQATFQSLGENLNSCFRKMAILVHPDKNSHPLSKRAFQKLSQVLMTCQETR